ncbi:predicted protein [Clavispora lusitaniae ATCC 42720]|uniref:Uncharacterized protein n=1 Tax=Clavispora lusitaniae (strain ATCC 42720) TaxID=306902 RepID=C4Y5I3_CLAL4|nr:uncharacterized protein CLUG_03417 [Clavispora lusitaniae ATCC 42720]EEQ39289.1 predicted protein [Clavispora lusitaniae ATCC 42720]
MIGRMVVLVAVVGQSSMSYCLRCLRCLQSSVFTDVFSLHSCLLANFCCPLSFSIVRRYRYQRPVQQERNTPAIVILCSLFRSLSLSILLGPSGCILPGRSSCSTSLTILHSPFASPPCSPVVACTFSLQRPPLLHSRGHSPRTRRFYTCSPIPGLNATARDRTRARAAKPAAHCSCFVYGACQRGQGQSSPAAECGFGAAPL